jgi:D-alanyl-lipoteichoic acid acyltransferase DltB (MBOAT superfamily)
MSFASPAFVVFFLLFFWVWPNLHGRARPLFLLAASYLFYASWSAPLLLLLIGSTLLDFSVARAIHRSEDPGRRRRLLALSLIGNLGALAFFKYHDFFAGSAAAGLQALGLDIGAPTLAVVLPVGISFYTFQTLGYSVDVYRRHIVPCASPLDFALYVAYFPQLVAGPIERAGHLLPQLAALSSRVAPRADLSGFGLIALGAFKKVVIADNLAPIVDAVYADPAHAWAPALWFATYAFAFQIFCDFSGYSDMAVGVARLMGVSLTQNFRAPYAAAGPAELWRRWHISLSSWLRDYLYVPLGGNRHGPWRTARNLLLTMLLGGLWHGAAWHFVLWGAYHGLLLVLFRPGFWARLYRRLPLQPLVRLLRWFVFFHLVCLGWALFRAPDLAACGVVLGRLLDPRGWHWSAWLGEVAASGEGRLLAMWGTVMATLLLVQVAGRVGSEEWVARVWRAPHALRFLFVVALLYACVLLAPEAPQPFIYFQF